MSQNEPLLFTPTSEDYHTLSFKLNSFPTGLPAFALVLLQATKQSEWSFRKVNHVNSMMSFFCLEPSGAAHLTYCVSQIPCLSLWSSGWTSPLILQLPHLNLFPSLTELPSHWSLCCPLHTLNTLRLGSFASAVPSAWLLVSPLDEHGLVSPVIQNSMPMLSSICLLFLLTPYPHHLVYVMCSVFNFRCFEIKVKAKFFIIFVWHSHYYDSSPG